MDEPHIPILTATGRIPVPPSFIAPGMAMPPHTAETANRTVHETKPTLACPYCASTHIIKKGTRRNKYGAVQLFACKDCAKKFTPLVTKHHTTPLRVILECLTRYNRLEPIPLIVRAVRQKYGITITPHAIRRWLRDFRDHTSIAQLRAQIAESTDHPRHLILESRLFHGQVYDFQYHRAKAAVLFADSRHAPYRALADFLERVPRECPHHLFAQNLTRASQFKPCFCLDEVVITPKTNAAVATARFVLQAVSNNKLRHETLQSFLLANDAATIAVEVPITLTAEDIAYYHSVAGFAVPLVIPDGQTITGHIDIVQLRGGRIHILDYKPDAEKIKPIAQLMVYALALSRLTKLPLRFFTCAWFDDTHYFSFYPLPVVYKKRGVKSAL